jgi:hypothetical protein
MGNKQQPCERYYIIGYKKLKGDEEGQGDTR